MEAGAVEEDGAGPWQIHLKARPLKASRVTQVVHADVPDLKARQVEGGGHRSAPVGSLLPHDRHTVLRCLLRSRYST